MGGCGYRLVTAESALSPGARTIAIPLFDNRSREPGIEGEVTRAVRTSFLRDGRLRLAPQAGADLLLLGTIRHYGLSPLAFDRADAVLEYRVTVSVDIALVARESQEVLLQQTVNPAQEEYLVRADIVSAEIARKLALRQAFQRLGDQIVSLILEGF
ncbi:MAG: hypothetical protein D6736_01855 [Nitrospinota bacterium]|nr:MAG: hypothetical protein D6736_01855 [Nitrospinota bacterium]